MREAEDAEDVSTDTMRTIARSSFDTPPVGKTSSRLSGLPEEDDFLADHYDASALGVVCLNLGSRNTNPVEFELKGDSSDVAVEAMAVLRRAKKTMKSAKEGPMSMLASEMKVVEGILNKIFEDSLDESHSEWQLRIRQFFGFVTWAEVLSTIEATTPHLFNAFNLRTLELNRPSVWENPASCREFTNTKEYMMAWKQWYCELDRASEFWLEDAPRVAKKRSMEMPLCFAGLFLFDLMCLFTARCALGAADEDDSHDLSEDAREVPFNELARFAAKLPASSFKARHMQAQRFTVGAHAVLAQEGRSFAHHPSIAEEFLPPFFASDGFTAVFLRKDSFNHATDISFVVVKRMEELVHGEASQDSRKAWQATANRLAAVSCQCQPQLGNLRVCFASLHVSNSDCTADFIEKLREVLADYDADLNILGMDSNIAAKDTSTFQKRLRKAGFEIGCSPKQQQVTVAKQRTAFQTQLQKVGDLDISHKDYIVSWTSLRVRRGPTTYTPDLRTSYGVEQETKQCVRLPTTKWPFDHCGVATSFKQTSRCSDSVRCNQCSCCRCCLVSLILLLFASPLASKARANPYGEPGAWYHDSSIFTKRLGICETAAPCPEDWVQYQGSCYLTTPKLAYPDVQRFCEEFNGSPIAIQSEAENTLVLQSLCPKGDFCYIGLKRTFSGIQYWVSGEEYNYTRLVETERSSVPFFENSRSTDYSSTLVVNLPGEVDGCDVSLSLSFESDPSVVAKVQTVAIPALSVIVAGIILAMPRPRNQRFASRLLCFSLIVKLVWLGQPLLTSCFVDNHLTKLSIISFGGLIDSGGHTAISMLSLWMIVARMSMLYPSKAPKRMFRAIVACWVIILAIYAAFIDITAPMAWTWAVILFLSLKVVLIVLYVVVSVLVSIDLYRTWACLRREATNGCNDQGTILQKSEREARLHFFTVCAAIMTGALRWAAVLLAAFSATRPEFPEGITGAYMLASFLDSATNDICTHFLACMNIDAAITRAKGVTTEVAERAEREVQQHQVAVQMLKAAPTSAEQLREFAALEREAKAAIGSDQEKTAFLILKSAIRVETARIHKLMHCVRVRAMTMGLRYQYLIDVPGLDNGAPRQLVPEEFGGAKSEAAASKYFDWLYGQSSGAEQVLFHQLNHLLSKFNNTDWPSDLGLAPEEFPWRIWARSKERGVGMKRLPKDAVVSPGDTLIHRSSKTSCLTKVPCTLCIMLEETSPDSVSIHCSGMASTQQVPRDELRTGHGGGVFIPGPLKKQHRCMEKITADYEGSVLSPAAASLVDICRCMVLCDDPYAAAVFVAYLRKNMKVVRVKNRFSEDVVESHVAGELQSMFSAAASSLGSEYQMNSGASTQSTHQQSTDQQYRDISINVAVKTPSGHPFICEIQVTLSNLAILKHADTTLYTIRRMRSPGELCKANVFAGNEEEVCSPA